MTSKKLLSVLAALAVSASAFAQPTSTTTSSSGGLLGQRYVEGSFGLEDTKDLSDDLYDVGIAINLPVLPGVDIGLGYSYSWADIGTSVGTVDVTGHTVGASATLYSTTGAVKPFIGGSIGYQWAEAKLGTITADDESGIWNAGIGVEVPFGPVLLTPSIVYSDSFEDDGDGSFLYGVEANYWFTPKVGGFADVTNANVRGSSGESWIYTVGLRVKL